MSSRINHLQTAPALIKTLIDAGTASANSSVDHAIKNLVDIRASQLNSCAFCLDMHIKQAKIRGERELRIYHLAIWRESSLFTAKEKAALLLTEHLTKISSDGISDAIFNEVKEHFSEIEISEIAFQIGLINMWNRLQILSQMEPGALDEAFGLTKANLI